MQVKCEEDQVLVEITFRNKNAMLFQLSTMTA